MNDASSLSSASSIAELVAGGADELLRPWSDDFAGTPASCDLVGRHQHDLSDNNRAGVTAAIAAGLQVLVLAVAAERTT